MKTALLFSGQGERGLYAAVQKGLSDESPLLALALQAAECSEDSLSRDGGRALEQSRYLQPVLVALSLTQANRCRDQGLEVDFVAGHSLGELAAWSFAGAMTPEEAVDIAAVRGRAMGRAARARSGGMLALTDVGDADLEPMLETGRAQGPLTVGAYNAPQEVVLSGVPPALQAVAPLCRSRSLPVEGAWHSPLMEEAKEEFSSALEGLSSERHVSPLVSGLDGACLDATHDVKDRLAEQLIQPLQWTSVLATLSSKGVDRFLIAGPGRVLRYLVRCNLPSADVRML